jgi:hypothetical protein
MPVAVSTVAGQATCIYPSFTASASVASPPARAPDRRVETTQSGFRNRIVFHANGDGEQMARDGQRAHPRRFRACLDVPGFNLPGEVDIGGEGSDFKHASGGIPAPIEEKPTLRRWTFFVALSGSPKWTGNT